MRCPETMQVRRGRTGGTAPWPERRSVALGRTASMLILLVAVAPVSGSLRAQTFEGRVLDQEDDGPVATAIVRLVDGEGEQVAVTAADSSGHYRIAAPGPGAFRLRAERIGYEEMETPLLEAGMPDRLYPLDLLMRRAPVPIAGLEVTTEQIDERLRLLIGISPRALRWDPIRGDALLRHVERAHDLTALMRWQNHGRIEVRESTDGPCYLVRRYGCLPVYLDGFSLTPETFDLVPLEMLHTILVIAPNESVQYLRGAVLMYTQGWLR